MTRVELYDQAKRRYRETSRQAFESVAPFLAPIDALIVHAIAATGEDGLTCAEVEERTRLKHQTVSAQIRHLSVSGVLQSANRTRRPASGGRPGMVWLVPSDLRRGA